MKRKYYTLIASLPYLPRFDQAQRLPITAERLQKRLTMLHGEDAKTVEQIFNFIFWQRLSTTLSDMDFLHSYQALQKLLDKSSFIKIIEFRVDLRTILIALRMRRAKELPKAKKVWAIGNWVKHIEQNWEHPHFRLIAQFPWISNAINFLEKEQPRELEHMLMELTWRKLDQNLYNHFSLEALLAYLFKWDILERWLLYDTKAAKDRFEKLLMEVPIEHGN